MFAFMKKEYMELECTVVSFENEDIVTASGEGLMGLSGGGDNGFDFTENFGNVN